MSIYTVKFYIEGKDEPLVFKNVKTVVPQKGENSVALTFERYGQSQVIFSLSRCLYYTKFNLDQYDKAKADCSLPE